MIYLVSFALVVLIIFILIFLLILVDSIEKIRLFKITTNFEKYLLPFEYHKKKAYDIIYKDKILVYSLDATRINDKDFSFISKDFILLVFKLIGPNLKSELCTLYGNEETLIFNLMEYFNSTFEDDEIRKKAEDNMMNSESSDLIL